MRVKLAMCVFLLCGALCAGAYEAGDVTLSAGGIFSPLELGTAWGEVYVDNQTAAVHHDAKLGHPGLGGEVQALYFVTPRVGVGVSFADQYFASDLASGLYLKTHTRIRNYMAVGHVFLTPQSGWPMYIALGAGAADSTFGIDFHPAGGGNTHFNYTGFAYYAGLGVEKTLSSRFSLGLEARYNGNKFHNAQVASHGPRYTVRPKMNFMSVLLRLIYRV